MATEYASAYTKILARNTLDTTIIISHQGRTSKRAGGTGGPVGAPYTGAFVVLGYKGGKRGPHDSIVMSYIEYFSQRTKKWIKKKTQPHVHHRAQVQLIES